MSSNNCLSLKSTTITGEVRQHLTGSVVTRSPFSTPQEYMSFIAAAFDEGHRIWTEEEHGPNLLILRALMADIMRAAAMTIILYETDPSELSPVYETPPITRKKGTPALNLKYGSLYIRCEKDINAALGMSILFASRVLRGSIMTTPVWYEVQDAIQKHREEHQTWKAVGGLPEDEPQLDPAIAAARTYRGAWTTVPLVEKNMVPYSLLRTPEKVTELTKLLEVMRPKIRPTGRKTMDLPDAVALAKKRFSEATHSA